MKRVGFAVLGLSFLAVVDVAAKPSQEVIDQCMKATDFKGCVETLTGDTGPKSETKMTIDIDKIRNTGNKCPANWAYIGAGRCREVICLEGVARPNHPQLGGKGWRCRNRWLLYIYYRPSVQYGNAQAVRAVTDERCPLIEPEIGKNNSCQNNLTEEQIFSFSDEDIRRGKI